MFATLFLLAASFGADYQRSVGIATTVCNVVAADDASWAFPTLAAEDPWAARAKLGRLLVVWSFAESSFRADVVGDNGRSVGLMQMNPGLVGRSAAELRNPHVNLVAAVGLLRRLVAECGTLPRALGSYAGGHCGVAARSLAAARDRCRLAGAGAC